MLRMFWFIIITKEVAQERKNTPSPAFILPQRPKEELGTILQWRVELAKRLEEKDAKESETMAKYRYKAQQELKDWYKRYEDNLSKTKESNCENGKEFMFDDINPGTKWERVTTLCNLSGKNANKNKTKAMSVQNEVHFNQCETARNEQSQERQLNPVMQSDTKRKSKKKIVSFNI